MKFTIKTLALTSMIVLGAAGSYAGTVTVKNENSKIMTLDIVPKGGTKDQVYEQKLSGQHFVTFDVRPENLGGKSIYTIVGKTGLTEMISGGKCENLSTDKDYTVTFTDDKVGTSCIATPTN